MRVQRGATRGVVGVLSGVMLSGALMVLDAMATAVPPPVKCVSFNLLHGGVWSGLWGDGQDLERRLELAAEELQALQVDLIGLQEASLTRGRGNVAERLARKLGFAYVFAPAGLRLFASERMNRFTTWVMNFSEGPAILSRFPIVASRAHDLPRCGRWTDPRVVLCATVDTPWGPLTVCSTHTSGTLCQSRGLVEFVLQQRGPLPLLLMGDLNASEDAPAVTLLTREAGFLDTFRVANPATPGFTVWQWVYASRPMAFRRVDYLFLLPGRDFPGAVLSSRVVLNTPRQLQDGTVLWPSDHYGVLSEVVVFPPPP